MSQKNAISVSGDQVILSARIVDTQNSRGIEGLLVEVFDKDFIGKDDYLGSAITQQEGLFELHFKQSAFSDFSMDKRPDLYFKISHQNELLLNTREHPIQNADEKTPDILVTVTSPDERKTAAKLSGATMGWEKVADVAQYKGADWKNEVRRAANVTMEEAKKIADADPTITYFILLREPMFLEGKAGPNGYTEKGQFNPRDAVFFSGKPSYGSAPQADAYEKRKITWEKKENSAQYKGADWSNEIFRMNNLTPSMAIEIAENNPSITYFFICHDTMWLEGKEGPGGWSEKGHFHDGDVVFFSGKPRYGGAPQANAFEKTATPLWV